MTLTTEQPAHGLSHERSAAQPSLLLPLLKGATASLQPLPEKRERATLSSVMRNGRMASLANLASEVVEQTLECVGIGESHEGDPGQGTGNVRIVIDSVLWVS